LWVVGAGGDEGLVVDEWVQEGVDEMEKGGGLSAGSCGGAEEGKLLV